MIIFQEITLKVYILHSEITFPQGIGFSAYIFWGKDQRTRLNSDSVILVYLLVAPVPSKLKAQKSV